MKRLEELRGFNQFDDEDRGVISLVSGPLPAAAPRADGAFGRTDPQRDGELQSLLLMASMMLGGERGRLA